VGFVDEGVACFQLPYGDTSIDHYQAVGGAHFHERSGEALTMSVLDTPVYHGYLEMLRQGAENGTVADVGGGDGRNAWPWLLWGNTRVVVTDPALGGLKRLRERAAKHDPSWLDRLLLIQADARRLPLHSGFAARVMAVESLGYLNEDYETGLGECTRILKKSGRLLVSDKDYETGLMVQLLYKPGLEGVLRAAGSRNVWDITPRGEVRNRSFTGNELRETIAYQGLNILFQGGVSALALIVSYLRSQGKINAQEALPGQKEELEGILCDLGRQGQLWRCHVVMAEK